MNTFINFELITYAFMSSLVSFGGVYLYEKIANKLKIVSNPNFRTLHEEPIPRGGGFVFSISFILVIFISWKHFQLSDTLVFILGVGGGLAALFGFIDDVKNIRARVKLGIQFMLSGGVIFLLYSENLLLLSWMPNFITIPAFLFGMVWMMNAYNFMDGVDGMAASGAIFASLTLALVLLIGDGSDTLIPIFIVIASTVSGFIVFNWPPATIFMGDAGSVFLGFTFGSLFLFTTINGELSIWNWLMVFGYFFSDTTVTQIVRVISVKKWYLAHRSHAYQNIARITKSHSKVTVGVIMYDVIWILPLTVWSVLEPEMAPILAMAAIAPALVVSFKYGPLLSSS